MGVAVLSQTALEESKVYWPLSSKATCCFLSLLSVFLTIIIIALKVCNDQGICTDSWWNLLHGHHQPANAAQYCERGKNSGFLQQPWNSLSNFAYAYVCFVLLMIAVADWIRLKTQALNHHQANAFKLRRNVIIEWPVYTLYMAICVLYLFVASFTFHAHGTSVTQLLDLTGVYLPVCTLTLTPMLNTLNINAEQKYFRYKRLVALFLIMLVALATIVALTIDGLPETRDAAFVLEVYAAVFVVLIAVLEMRYRVPCCKRVFYPRQQRYAYYKAKVLFPVVLTLMLVAGIMNEDLFIKDLPCDSSTPLQYHSAWHILTALAILLCYLFSRSYTIVYDGESVSGNHVVQPSEVRHKNVQEVIGEQ